MLKGDLLIYCIEANLTRDVEVLGKMDPFVIFEIGEEVQETFVVDNAGKLPKWNEILKFNNCVGKQKLIFSVFDKETNSKRIVGKGEMMLEEIHYEKNWHELFFEGKNVGNILLNVMFYPKKEKILEKINNINNVNKTFEKKINNLNEQKNELSKTIEKINQDNDKLEKEILNKNQGLQDISLNLAEINKQCDLFENNENNKLFIKAIDGNNNVEYSTLISNFDNPFWEEELIMYFSHEETFIFEFSRFFNNKITILGLFNFSFIQILGEKDYQTFSFPIFNEKINCGIVYFSIKTIHK